MSKKIINVTKEAEKYLLNLKNSDINNIYLRISVKQGGCSGLSYTMHFESKEHIHQHDEIIDVNNLKIVCDSKSLLYLYGLSLEYKDELIGGGFHFVNPNAVQTCGCGKSFSV